MQYPESKQLCDKVLKLDVNLQLHITQNEEKEQYSDAYLLHGVAAEKWKENGRNRRLQEFMTDICNHERLSGIPLLSQALINLASEMGKECKK